MPFVRLLRVFFPTSVSTPTAKDKGKIMKELMPKVKGKAEGSVVNKIVGEFLQ